MSGSTVECSVIICLSVYSQLAIDLPHLISTHHLNHTIWINIMIKCIWWTDKAEIINSVCSLLSYFTEIHIMNESHRIQLWWTKLGILSIIHKDQLHCFHCFTTPNSRCNSFHSWGRVLFLTWFTLSITYHPHPYSFNITWHLFLIPYIILTEPVFWEVFLVNITRIFVNFTTAFTNNALCFGITESWIWDNQMISKHHNMKVDHTDVCSHDLLDYHQQPTVYQEDEEMTPRLRPRPRPRRRWLPRPEGTIVPFNFYMKR